MDKPARRSISSSSSVSSPTPPSTSSLPSRDTSFRFNCFKQERCFISFYAMTSYSTHQRHLLFMMFMDHWWYLIFQTHCDILVMQPSLCLHSTYKLSLSTAFSSCSSASSPWRRLRDRRRPKLEPEQWTRSRIRQLSIISFWFDRHNEILLVWSRILFVYLKIRLRWLIRINGGGSLELDMNI